MLPSNIEEVEADNQQDKQPYIDRAAVFRILAICFQVSDTHRNYFSCKNKKNPIFAPLFFTAVRQLASRSPASRVKLNEYGKRQHCNRSDRRHPRHVGTRPDDRRHQVCDHHPRFGMASRHGENLRRSVGTQDIGRHRRVSFGSMDHQVGQEMDGQRIDEPPWRRHPAWLLVELGLGGALFHPDYCRCGHFGHQHIVAGGTVGLGWLGGWHVVGRHLAELRGRRAHRHVPALQGGRLHLGARL